MRPLPPVSTVWLALSLLAPLAPARDAVSPGAGPPASVRLIDVTGDGVVDLLASAADGTLSVSVHDGVRGFRPVPQVLPRVALRSVLVTDLDGDGRTDLYLVGASDNAALLGDGTGWFRDVTGELGLTEPGPGTSAERMDVDGDGFADLVVHNAGGDVLFWRLPNGTFVRAEATPAAATASGGRGPGASGGSGGFTGAGTGPDGDGTGPDDGPGAGPTAGPTTAPSPEAPHGASGTGALLGGTGDLLDVDGRLDGVGAGTDVLDDDLFGLVGLFDQLYVNDGAGEVDASDVLDGSLTGADVSTSVGDVTHSGGRVGLGGSPLPTARVTVTDPMGAALALTGPGVDGSGARLDFGTDATTYLEEDVDDHLLVQTTTGMRLFSNAAGGSSGASLFAENLAAGDTRALVARSFGTGVAAQINNQGTGPHLACSPGGGVDVFKVGHDGDVSIESSAPLPALDIEAEGALASGILVQCEGLGAALKAVASGFGNITALEVRQEQGGDYIRCIDPSNDVLFEVSNSGRVITTTLQITGGGDLVEGFDAGGTSCPPGTVVVIDPDRPGMVRPSAEAYDRKVAGVVSGAGGIRHGLRMGQDGVLDGDTLVAMTGRVHVLCTTEGGPIRPGDRLTTAGRPGHAMRVAEGEPADGAVLGKAMTALDEGTGLVLVLVNLQ